jgi:hypothetical protein
MCSMFITISGREFSSAAMVIRVNEYINHHYPVLIITVRMYFLRFIAGKLKRMTSLNVGVSGFF